MIVLSKALLLIFFKINNNPEINILLRLFTQSAYVLQVIFLRVFSFVNKF